MGKKMHSIRYNFIMNFFLTATQLLFPLITFPYVSRVLLAVGNGKISFAASVANYFMMIASLGIPTYGVRACAQVREDKEKLSKTVQEIFLINLVMTILVILTYIIAIETVPRFQEDKILFLINGINIFLNMFGMNWLYQALEQYDYITIRSVLFKVLSILLMFALVHRKEDYIIYAGINVFAAVGSYILNFTRSRKFVSYKRFENYDIKKHIRPILVLFAQSLAVSIYTNLDTVMLGFMKSDTDVGYYNAAVKVKMILLSVVSSLGNVLLPRMAFYAKQKKYVEFKRIMLKSLNFVMCISFPLVIYFCIYAKETINFLAGNGYLGAVLAMQFITIAVIPNGLTGVLGVQVLTAIEKEVYVLCSVVVGAITDLFLNIIFIPKYGAAGAALATTIAEFMVLFVQMYFTRDYLKELYKKFRVHLYVLIAIVSAFFVIVVKRMEITSPFIILLSSSILYFSVYGIGMLLAKEEIVVEVINVIKHKLLKRGKQ